MAVSGGVGWVGLGWVELAWLGLETYGEGKLGWDRIEVGWVGRCGVGRGGFGWTGRDVCVGSFAQEERFTRHNMRCSEALRHAA